MLLQKAGSPSRLHLLSFLESRLPPLPRPKVVGAFSHFLFRRIRPELFWRGSFSHRGPFFGHPGLEVAVHFWRFL